MSERRYSTLGFDTDCMLPTFQVLPMYVFRDTERPYLFKDAFGTDIGAGEVDALSPIENSGTRKSMATLRGTAAIGEPSRSLVGAL
jgi:hypothetical protein